ncbi:MAG: hypothetical protein ACFNL3_06005 [Rothia aeria]
MKKLDRLPLRRALISVYDKTNLAEFARGLHEAGVKLAKPAGSKDELNEVFRQVALKGELRRQIGYSDSHEAVSTDFVGSRNAGVVDALATVVTDDSAILYVWYDNEFGYSCQVVRVLERLVGEEAPSYPTQ